MSAPVLTLIDEAMAHLSAPPPRTASTVEERASRGEKRKHETDADNARRVRPAASSSSAAAVTSNVDVAAIPIALAVELVLQTLLRIPSIPPLVATSAARKDPRRRDPRRPGVSAGDETAPAQMPIAISSATPEIPTLSLPSNLNITLNPEAVEEIEPEAEPPKPYVFGPSSEPAPDALVAKLFGRILASEAPASDLRGHSLWVGLVIKLVALEMDPSLEIHQKLRTRFIEFVMEGFRERLDLVLSWLHAELYKSVVEKHTGEDRYAGAVQRVLDSVRDMKFQGDRVLLKFFLEIPKLTDACFTFIQEIAVSEQSFSLGLSVFNELVLHRQAARLRALDYLLQFTAHATKAIRTQAITLIAELSAKESAASWAPEVIERFIEAQLTRVVADKGAAITELPIEFELFFAFLTRHPRLLFK